MNKNEAARYLGVKPSELDEKTEALIEKGALELEKVLSPKHIHAVFDIKTDGRTVIFPSFRVESESLAKHLEGCSEAAVFAATLGVEADRLITRKSYENIGEAAVIQACAAVMLEEYCDSVTDELEDIENNRFLKPRFSPGYGDFSTAHQHDIISVLNASKRIGLFATDADMLTPTKSVTAIIGITDEKSGCNKNKCMECENKNCVFRKE